MTISLGILILFGLWRMWLGGVPKMEFKGHTWVQYAVGVIIVAMAVKMVPVEKNEWAPLASGVLFVLYFRLWDRGEAQTYPLKVSANDPALPLFAGMQNRGLAWWLYMVVGYVIPGLAMGGLLGLLGGTPWPLFLAGSAVPLAYYLAWQLKERLPYAWIGAIGGVQQHTYLADFVNGLLIGWAMLATWV